MTLALSLVVFSVMLGVAVWRLVGFLGQFKPVPGFHGARYAGRVDPERLTKALEMAISLLSALRNWPAVDVAATVNATTIVVMPSPSWTDGYGRRIAGDADGMVRVGSDLAALCHELAHLHEVRTTGKTDETHQSWQANGIQRACDEFEGWVRNG